MTMSFVKALAAPVAVAVSIAVLSAGGASTLSIAVAFLVSMAALLISVE